MSTIRRSLLLLALSLVACASATESGSGAARVTTPSGRTVAVGPQNNGQTISASIGDTIVIDLGPGAAVVRGGWKLLLAPNDVLSLVASDAEAGRFELRAVAAGDQRVVLTGTATCGDSPLRAQSDVRCPQGGSGGYVVGGSLGVPVVRFAVDVVVR